MVTTTTMPEWQKTGARVTVHDLWGPYDGTVAVAERMENGRGELTTFLTIRKDTGGTVMVSAGQVSPAQDRPQDLPGFVTVTVAYMPGAVGMEFRNTSTGDTVIIPGQPGDRGELARAHLGTGPLELVGRRDTEDRTEYTYRITSA